MFYVRSPAEGGQESIAEALNVLWHVVPSVQGIFFKDLKQTLRKEQCDVSLMLWMISTYYWCRLIVNFRNIFWHEPDFKNLIWMS